MKKARPRKLVSLKARPLIMMLFSRKNDPGFFYVILCGIKMETWDTISVRRWCYIKMHILLCYANCIILPLKSAFPLSRKFS